MKKKSKKTKIIRTSKIKKKKKKKNITIAKNHFIKSKTIDPKIEIKKIKKQPNEKRIYNVNNFIIYPKHGIGKIISVEKATMGNIEISFYKVFIEQEKLTLSIPINQQSRLRAISSPNQVKKSITILKSKPKVKRTMWSRRAQEYENKINSGKIYDLAEVVRDLNKDNGVLADQSYSERQLFEKAYDRLIREFEVVLKISADDTRKKVDKALNRNQHQDIEQ